MAVLCEQREHLTAERETSCRWTSLLYGISYCHRGGVTTSGYSESHVGMATHIEGVATESGVAAPKYG